VVHSSDEGVGEIFADPTRAGVGLAPCGDDGEICTGVKVSCKVFTVVLCVYGVSTVDDRLFCVEGDCCRR